MLGAIVGDVAGSHYEHFPTKSLDFDFFREHSCVTDDSVLTIAVADWILHEFRHSYSFDVSCAGSVPESIIAFMESDSFESAICLAISLGGDSDTMACIAGAIAEPYYGGVPDNLWQTTKTHLDDKMLVVVDSFRSKFDTAPKTAE